MRICLLAESALPAHGGMELAVDRMARGFAAAGCEVTLVARGSAGDAPHDARLPYRMVRVDANPNRPEGAEAFREALEALWQREPSGLLHCHGIYPVAYAAARCRDILGVPLVVTEHADLSLEHLSFYGRHAVDWTRWSLPRMDVLVASTRNLARQLAEFGGGALIVEIPLGVDVEELARPVLRPEGLDPAIRPGRFALFLGRMAHQKGATVLLEALRHTRERGGVEVVLAGDGARDEAIRARATALGVAHRVRFLGWVEGALKTWLLQSCLCTAVPSRGSEAFCLVVSESHAAGRPVLASAIPCLDERIRPGETGELVAEGDPKALGQALAWFLDHPSEADAMGERGRREAREYDWQRVVARHLELYAGLLEEG